MTFKAGDKVKVLRKAKDYENGWENAWVSEMDERVGQIGTVVRHRKLLKDVILEFSGSEDTLGFPEFVLELVPEAGEFAVGDRVRVEYSANSIWAGEGFVPSFARVFVVDEVSPSGNIAVVMSTGGAAGEQGYFPASQLEFPQPFQEEKKASEQGKQSGIARAIAGHSAAFKQARLAALELGRTVKFVNADMVQAELEKLGLKSSDLGNAAGGIFRGKMWKDTGRSILSNRGKSHRRKITVWEYVGESLAGGVRTSASVVPVGTKTEYTLTELTPATAKIGLKVAVGPKYNHNDSCKKFVGIKGEIVALPVVGKEFITVLVEHIEDYNREMLFYPHELVLSETPAQPAPGTKATRENLKVGTKVKSNSKAYEGIQHIGGESCLRILRFRKELAC
jgi:hypothetical protein